MDINELLQEAKERYPIGTIFIPKNTNAQCIITTNCFNYLNGAQCINEVLPANNNKSIESKNVFHCVYSNDVWAKIILTPNKIYELWT